jgi:phosphatidylinositol alpha-1,6-mannosyltransferase
VSPAHVTNTAAPAVAAAPRLGEPLLAVPSLTESGGVAYVGRLIERVLSRALGHAPRTVSLERAGAPIALGDQWQFYRSLLSAQAARQADWVLFSHLGVARAQRWVPSALRRPHAIFLHGIEVWPKELTDDRKAVLRGAALRLSNSEYTARRVARAHPDVGAIVACPLGLLPAEAPTDAVDESLLSRVRPTSALIVSRLSAAERYKGHDQLLECWPDVVRRLPEAQLVIAGAGDDLARLQGRAMELGVAPSVLFCGFVSDATLSALWQRVAALAMPSRGEGFGLVYLEAMRAGLPCLGAKDDAAGDVIADGETGILVDQSDRSALTAALVTLLSDRATSRAMGAAGRARFERLFTFDLFERRLLALLQSAFGR